MRLCTLKETAVHLPIWAVATLKVRVKANLESSEIKTRIRFVQCSRMNHLVTSFASLMICLRVLWDGTEADGWKAGFTTSMVRWLKLVNHFLHCAFVWDSNKMANGFSHALRGYTIVELMVTVVIVAVLAATVGTFIVKLLTFQEKDREEAYVREKLVDICGAYADLLSVGSLVSMQTNSSDQVMYVGYRRETGGVSLETGIVSRVTSLESSLRMKNHEVDINVYGLESGSNVLKLARTANGIAPLIPLVGDIVNCTITPLNNEALGNLRVSAQYRIRNDAGKLEPRITSVERIVRLWNHK